MRTAGEYRSIARSGLAEKWGSAIIAAMVMSFLGVSLPFVNGYVTVNYEDRSVAPLEKLINHPAWARYAGFFAFISMLAAVFAVIAFIIGGAAEIGYADFNLRIVDGEDAEVTDIFSRMNRLIHGFMYRLLTLIYLVLWSLLFMVPGIVKIFSYAMTPYIMNDDPVLSVNEAITMSRKIMDGKKARLFGLYLSFIGWSLLANSPTVIIAFIANSRSYTFLANPLTFCAVITLTAVSWAGNCMVAAYSNAAKAAFYKDAMGEYQMANQGNTYGFGPGGPAAGHYDQVQPGANVKNTGSGNYGYSNYTGYAMGTDGGGKAGSGEMEVSDNGAASGGNAGSYSYGNNNDKGNSGNVEGGSTVDNPFEMK